MRINSQDYELTLVDTAGQDELTLFPSQYSIDVHGYVLVYSITDIRSFEVVGTIFHKLQDLNGKIQCVLHYYYFYYSIIRMVVIIVIKLN